MIQYLKTLLVLGTFALTYMAGPLWAADVTIGVSIPAATHGWTGGLNYFAQDTIKKMHKAKKT